MDVTQHKLSGAALATQVFEQLVTLLPAGKADEFASFKVQDRPDKALLRAGFISEQVLAAAYAETLSLPFLDDDERPTLTPDQTGLSPSFLREKECIPFQETPEALIVAMADPLDEETIRAIEMATRKKTLPIVATPQQVISLLSRQGVTPTLVSAVSKKTEDKATDDQTGAVRDLQLILEDAVAQGASDIHLEADATDLRIRMRFDGLLQDASSVETRSGDTDRVMGRLKVLAGLDISEKRVPQDGRLQQMIAGRSIDMRVSIVPGLYGESAVVRLLDSKSGPQDLSALGFHEHLVTGVLRLLQQPHGLFLVTGPTGSGKTTTLYALLRMLNLPERKILTVEDPVEYQLDGIMQVAARPSIGLGFAEALRSFLRHDPDILMVGEIRDSETARVAVQAALTGHLVLSTVHTNDAIGAVDRLMDMGVEPFLLASVLRGVFAQRLVRRSCVHCGTNVPVPAKLKGFVPDHVDRILEPQGCARCRDTGFKGRFALGELLQVDETVAGQIAQKSPREDILATVRENGFMTLREDALLHLGERHTTPEEILRHLGDLS